MNKDNNQINFFKRIILYFKNISNIKKYCSFFNLQSKNEQSYKFMDDIPTKILEVYNYNKNRKKFKNIVSLFDSYEERKTIHNNIINIINETIKLFNFQNLLDNPLNVDKKAIVDKYINVYGLILKLKNKSSEYNSFCDHFIDVSENLELIQSQYRSYKKLDEIQKLNNYKYIDGLMEKDLNKINDEIKKFVDCCSKKYYSFNFIDIIDCVEKHNKLFIQNNLEDEIFKDVNGKSLDIEQRKTILKDDVSNLTVAGAGSGKTLTICGKVKYLIEKEKVNPSDILLLSYSHKSVEDLSSKIKNISDNLDVLTFHSLGLKIISSKYNKKQTIEEQFNAILEKYFKNEIFKDNNKLFRLLNYYGLYMNDDPNNPEFIEKGELYEYLKNEEFVTMKDQVIKYSSDKRKLVTFNKELVKSKQELAIANYYFLNGINYEYEKPYEIDTSTSLKRQYTPDFYLTDYHIYHEHYGIDDNGRTKQYNEDEEKAYLEGIRWKREIHKLNKTICLETTSAEFCNNTIFSNLKKQLDKYKVEFNPLSGDDIIKVVNSIYNDFSFNSIKNLISSFISLYKSNYTDEKGFEELKNKKFANIYLKNRAVLFLDICKDIYIYYRNTLFSEQKIDFDDMILQSISILPTLSDYKYKYIIVDEFQDISQSRMKLLKELIKHGNSKLFAVGDDWQSIYRFNGCDLNIFIDFKSYFEYAKINYISSTHRNSQELQNIACKFIMANPSQLRKKIISSKHLINPIRIAYYDTEIYDALLVALDEIYSINPKANVLLLGRNNKDLNNILNDHFVLSKKTSNKLFCYEYQTLNISFSTVHGSKGLEDDYVIIINTLNTKLGFPNKMEDDALLDLVLGKPDEYEYSEERRLWYVALTRTKNYTFLLVNKYNVSIFVKEIINDCYLINPNEELNTCHDLLCPICKTGVLKIKNYKGKMFYGCSNFPYCNYTNSYVGQINKNHRCKVCGDYMIRRNSKYGQFYSCHNLKCKYKEKI